MPKRRRAHLRAPQFEPEVIAAAARQAEGGDERIATTSISKITVRSVRLTSAWRKAHELNAMARVVEALPDHWLMLVRSMACDSRIGVYEVNTGPCRVQDMRCLAELFSDLLVAHVGGHNGVTLSSGPHAAVLVDGRWGEEPPAQRLDS
jgi:hypothetical protein